MAQLILQAEYSGPGRNGLAAEKLSELRETLCQGYRPAAEGTHTTGNPAAGPAERAQTSQCELLNLYLGQAEPITVTRLGRGEPGQ